VRYSGDIVAAVYENVIDCTVTDALSERAIIAPRRFHVAELNHRVLQRMEGAEKIYTSVDIAITEDEDDAAHYPVEFLNKCEGPGLPPHELHLKEGAIVMLLKNLDVKNALCNGTRCIVRSCGRHVLHCIFACGSRKMQTILIPRIHNYFDAPGGAAFRLRRTQFPAALSFAMSINKAQGQSFEKVGVCLPDPVFAHGQLYVALSRVRAKEGLIVANPAESKKISYIQRYSNDRSNEDKRGSQRRSS
ncbi:hypothetical protein OESDEN_15586, partial [Oesophagostomum dentatum]